MTKRDVVRQLVQLAVDVETVSIRACVDVEREAVGVRHDHIPSSVVEQRPDRLAAIKEKFERGDTRAADRSVARRVAGMGRRTLRERLWQQEASKSRADERKRC